MGLECRILPTSTRNLRQTKAEMRRELEELRWNMRHSQAPGSATESNYPHSTASPNMDMDREQYSDPSGRTDASHSLSPGFESRPPTRKGSGSNGTIPRMLEGFVLDPKRIDDCFMLYCTPSPPILLFLTSFLDSSHSTTLYSLFSMHHLGQTTITISHHSSFGPSL